MAELNQAACFIDTNIWLYALVDQGEKTVKAKQVIQECKPIISTQVINEICVNLIKKSSFEEGKIPTLIDSFYNRCQVIEIDKAILLNASSLRKKHQFSFWDSCITACALASGAAFLISEDLHAGMILGQMKVINPFKADI